MGARPALLLCGRSLQTSTVDARTGPCVTQTAGSAFALRKWALGAPSPENTRLKAEPPARRPDQEATFSPPSPSSASHRLARTSRKWQAGWEMRAVGTGAREGGTDRKNQPSISGRCCCTAWRGPHSPAWGKQEQERVGQGVAWEGLSVCEAGGRAGRTPPTRVSPASRPQSP